MSSMCALMFTAITEKVMCLPNAGNGRRVVGMGNFPAMGKHSGRLRLSHCYKAGEGRAHMPHAMHRHLFLEGSSINAPA